MELVIIIPLFLTILILLFSGIRQQRAFLEKEVRFHDTVSRLQNELSQQERKFRRSSEHCKKTIGRHQAALNQQVGNPSDFYNESPPKLFHTNAYWVALSTWYRAEQGWICEECGIDLKMRTQFLHVHHVHGRRYNAPEYLIALCVGCHADQPGHEFMKSGQGYRDFVTWRKGEVPPFI